MKGIFLIFTTIIISCSNNQINLPKEQLYKSNMSDTSINKIDSNQIHLTDSISINLNSFKSDIEQDSLFSKIKNNIKKYKDTLINLVSDTSLSLNSNCKKSRLHKGDVAFMVLDKIYHIPYFKAFKMQFDVYEKDCPYPKDLFDYFENNRDSICQSLKVYLRN